MALFDWLRRLWRRMRGTSEVVKPEAASLPVTPPVIQPEAEHLGLQYHPLAMRAKQIAENNDGDNVAPLQTYRYCGVIFPKTNWVYHYRTEDLSISVGDLVLVPVFVHNNFQDATGVVVSTGDYLPMSVPFPLQETSRIIRKL